MPVSIPPETFAALLRQFRQQQNLTQSQLAEAAGVDRSYLSYLERGLRNPTREVVLNLGRELQLAHTEMSKLLLSAQFAAEDDTTPIHDPVVELVVESIEGLAEVRRRSFRKELEDFVRYLRLRYNLASEDEVFSMAQQRPDREQHDAGQA